MSNRGKEGETTEYLDPTEQLKIAALVNRLCGIEEEEDFDQNVHPQIAQE